MEIFGKNNKMECKEFERRIPDYLAKKLDYPALKLFLEHLDECADCREELDIQFLVAEGMHRLAEGNAFDLQTDPSSSQCIPLSGDLHGACGAGNAGVHSHLDFIVKAVEYGGE